MSTTTVQPTDGFVINDSAPRRQLSPLTKRRWANFKANLGPTLTRLWGEVQRCSIVPRPPRQAYGSCWVEGRSYLFPVLAASGRS